MLIVIIAWLYVVVLMAVAEHSVTAGIMTFLCYGVLPLAIVLYLLNTPARRGRQQKRHTPAARSAGHSPSPRDDDPSSGVSD